MDILNAALYFRVAKRMYQTLEIEMFLYMWETLYSKLWAPNSSSIVSRLLLIAGNKQSKTFQMHGMYKKPLNGLKYLFERVIFISWGFNF